MRVASRNSYGEIKYGEENMDCGFIQGVVSTYVPGHVRICTMVCSYEIQTYDYILRQPFEGMYETLSSDPQYPCEKAVCASVEERVKDR